MPSFPATPLPQMALATCSSRLDEGGSARARSSQIGLVVVLLLVVAGSSRRAFTDIADAPPRSQRRVSRALLVGARDGRLPILHESGSGRPTKRPRAERPREGWREEEKHASRATADPFASGEHRAFGRRFQQRAPPLASLKGTRSLLTSATTMARARRHRRPRRSKILKMVAVVTWRGGKGGGGREQSEKRPSP